MQQRPASGAAPPAKNSVADLLRAVRGGENATGSPCPPPALRLTSNILRAGTRMRLLRDAGAGGAVVILRHKRGKTRLAVTHGAVDLPAELPLGRAELWLVHDDHVSGPVNVRIAAQPVDRGRRGRCRILRRNQE